MRRIKIFLIALLLCQNSFSKTLEDGETEYNNKRYENAFQIWKPLADAGDPFAQTMLCVLYENGQGVKKDYQKAIYWCKLGADKNIYAALFQLGSFYTNGFGVEKNYKIAFSYFHKAALLGHTKAQFNVGVSYFYGQGVSKNSIQSLKWLRIAKDNGFEHAKQEYENILFSMKPIDVAKALTLANDCIASKYKKCD
jgi:TPR repeat protein